MGPGGEEEDGSWAPGLYCLMDVSFLWEVKKQRVRATFREGFNEMRFVYGNACEASLRNGPEESLGGPGLRERFGRHVCIRWVLRVFQGSKHQSFPSQPKPIILYTEHFCPAGVAQ